ncbi:histidine kinase/DNA gyrase B/HSP90-like ATPase [Paenibacillus sp. BK033]|uniref:sensor histidine kinase n=1 Tax=Paenibacillus sp. BK033 TaxID=2512133 RepID=UPI001050F385|nr:histidine kinase [Paenibacillus sp. BK033]TCM86034.1 histidine kinase/DNA gyrase B/HSP90-like ATPase [Paenibacillus sp. BK033]
MNTVQKKILSLTAIVLFIMVAIWFILTYYNQKMQDQYNDILQRYLQMNEVSASSQQLVTSLNNYIQTPTPSKLSNVEGDRQRLLNAQLHIADLRNNSNHFTLTNYLNLIDSLVDSTNRSIRLLNEKNNEEALNDFTEATRLSKYISEMTLTLLGTELQTYDQFYRGMIMQSVELKKLGVWMLALITFLLLLFTYWFSLSITRPIQRLTQAARELSRGRFDTHIEINANDEISFLAKTFDRMRININNLISEMQHKAQLESELQKNKLLLQESQLRSLQSQINPHFLFNTLDTLSKKAYLEGSLETSDLLTSVARLLRYNLKRLDRPVTLYEEVRVLREYIFIQKTRFTERLRFEEEVDEDCLYVQIPGLTIQPIIENAVIHAIEPLEEGGKITFRIRNEANDVIIEIEDEGSGMSEDTISQIMEDRFASQEGDGHSTGIGFGNVINRLKLYYGREDVLAIQSEVGKGTKVILKLPKEKEAG